VEEPVAAIDLNPVMVLPRGKGAVIVDATIEFARDAAVAAEAVES
jgi:hypothetical protein